MRAAPEQHRRQPGEGVTLPAGLRLAVFDLAGTTLDDLVEGEPLAVVAIRTALARAGLELETAAVTAVRGLEKREAIRQLCRKHMPAVIAGPAAEAAGATDAEEELVDRIHGYFKQALDEGLAKGPLKEVPGTSATFEALRSRGISIVVGSGFAEDIVRQLVARLGWKVDGLVSANRPKPDAIFEAMEMTGVRDVSQVIKIGDTVADVEEGRNAGVWTAAVLTGTQGEAALQRAGPDFVLRSVADIPSLFPPEGDRPGADGAALPAGCEPLADAPGSQAAGALRGATRIEGLAPVPGEAVKQAVNEAP